MTFHGVDPLKEKALGIKQTGMTVSGGCTDGGIILEELVRAPFPSKYLATRGFNHYPFAEFNTERVFRFSVLKPSRLAL